MALGGGLLYAHGGVFRDGLFIAATLQLQQEDLYEVNTYAKGVAYGHISTLWSGYRWHFKRGATVALGLHFSHVVPWRSFVDAHGSRSDETLKRMLEREETHWRPLLALGWRF
ncbi:MAG: hypothetical protein JXK05_04620 [Campylobacterales bacterium]|nr:hypothetical protein [Campylobacterales bacterium]